MLSGRQERNAPRHSSWRCPEKVSLVLPRCWSQNSWNHSVHTRDEVYAFVWWCMLLCGVVMGFGVVWSGVVWSGVVWRCVVVCCVKWSGVEWCGVVWSGVVWSGVECSEVE